MNDMPWALVTGASRGIGRAIAIELARVPLHVVVNYKSGAEPAAAVVDRIVTDGGSAEACGFDVADPALTRAAVETLIGRLGAPRVLVNNAGILRDGLMVWMKPEDWHQVIATNLNGFFHVTQPCLKPMLTERNGRIINIASTAGQMGNPGQTNYSAAKAGLIAATQALSREVARRGITVNCVAPGFIDTEMLAALPIDRIIGSIPARRLGRAEEVATAVRYLVSEEAAYVTGQVLAINGGLF
jgi:3-oxoacyl-[acyl-carrier protein] reductase